MKVVELNTKNDTIPTNLRLLLILEEISRVGIPITPTELNAQLGLPKPTIHRLFATLEAEGFLQRDVDGRSYTPGSRLRKLSTNVLSSLRVRTARLSVLNALAEKIGETCNITLPDREGMLYLDRVETKWPLRIQLPVGTMVPFHCTASGKLYLSSLPKTARNTLLTNLSLAARTPNTITDVTLLNGALDRIRADKIGTDDEEFLDGMVAVAVPVNDSEGRLFATLAVHAPRLRMSLDDAKAHIPVLREAANQLAALTDARQQD
ncbi:IclR family transcriptional regulator [Pelagibius sp.]|uniref:IclR family transcriptional regulator n=1 Tax=Pelagibius sp. TaxID=1931238 RepID=UPI003BAF4D92